jgi:5-methylcytosine-specific restriction endonuclease McrA
VDPDYFKDGAQRWQAENRERYRAHKKQYNQDNPHVVRARNRRYYDQHRERLKQAAREWYKTSDYFRQNREAHYERKRAFYAANPGWSAESQRRRRAQKIATCVVAFDPKLLASKLAYWGFKCWMCGGEPTGWDHVKPLSKGGSHVLANLRPACQPCNSRKLNRWPFPMARAS